MSPSLSAPTTVLLGSFLIVLFSVVALQPVAAGFSNEYIPGWRFPLHRHPLRPMNDSSPTSPIDGTTPQEDNDCTPRMQSDDCGSFVCLNVTRNDTFGYQCVPCETDQQCNQEKNGEMRICYPDHQCRHKHMFPHFDWRDGLTTVLSFCLSILASAAGVGGGGLLVPIFAFLGWGKQSIQMSLACATGTAVAMVFFQVRMRHPLANRPVIDYKLVLVLQPIVLIGTMPGTILHHILPSVMVYAMLLVLLALMVFRTFGKWRELWKKEHKSRANVNASSSSPTDPKDVKIVTSTGNESLRVPLTQGLEAPVDGSDKSLEVLAPSQEANLESILAMESRVPWKFVAALAACWVVVLVLAVIREKAVDCGTAGYWILDALYVPCLWVFSFFCGRHLLRLHAQKEAAGYVYATGDVIWTRRRLNLYPWIFLITGLFSSLLGIGGGIVVAPLLLELNLHPMVSSGVTSLLTLMTASSAVLQYLINGTSPIVYTFWYMAFGFIAGIIGRVWLEGLVKRTGRASYIILVLTILLGIASAMVLVLEIETIVDVASFSVTAVCSP